jgi:hypothetical protein
MLSYVRKHTFTITIGVSFFLCGFFTVANILHLTDRDVLIGLVAGAIGGITILVVSLIEDRRSRTVSVRTA